MAFSDLTVRLGVDGTGFDRYLKGAEGKITAWGAGIKGRLAALFGAGAIFGYARNIINEAGQVQDMADSMGLSPEQVQSMSAAAKPFGASMDSIAKAIRSLAKARAEAVSSPGGKTAGAFGALGIGPAQLRGLSDGQELLFAFSDALKNAQVNANNLPVILDLIGSKNQEVIPVLVAGMRQLALTARDAGMVMEDEVVGTLDDAGDAMDRLGRQLKTSLAKPLASIITLWSDGMNMIFKAMPGAANAFKAGGGANAIGKAVADAVAQAGFDVLDEKEGQAEMKDRARRARKQLVGLDELAGMNPADGRTSTVERRSERVRGSLAAIGGFTGSISGVSRTEQDMVAQLRTIARNTDRLVQQNED